jgi:hypothetical protein
MNKERSMRNRNGFIAAAVAVVLAAALPVAAATLKDVTLPDTAIIGGKECRLNGMGVRTKLVINVYVGGLYLATPTKDAATAIAADEPKRIVLHFVYSKVSAEQLREAWSDGFTGNAGPDAAALAERQAKFLAIFSQDALKGEEIVLTYVPGQGTEVVVKGKTAGIIEGADFMKSVFSIWLGAKPADKGLRKGLLSQ